MNHILQLVTILNEVEFQVGRLPLNPIGLLRWSLGRLGSTKVKSPKSLSVVPMLAMSRSASLVHVVVVSVAIGQWQCPYFL